MELLLPLSAALVAVVLLLLWRAFGSSRGTVAQQMCVPPVTTSAKDPYNAIEPLLDFDWATTHPIRLWPFKSKYHLTMGRSALL